MNFRCRTILLPLLLPSFLADGSSATSTESVEAFLPVSGVVVATYVEIEPDPAFDDFNRRLGESLEMDREWYVQYALEHRTEGQSQLPWHERLGVSREEYEYFAEPMNHFREISRQEITLRTMRSAARVRLDFVGEGLRLTRAELDLEAETVATPLDLLPLRGFVELERASLPPGLHRGVHFRTPEEKIRATFQRESMVIGEIRELDLGVIHYQLRSREDQYRIYITFSR